MFHKWQGFSEVTGRLLLKELYLKYQLHFYMLLDISVSTLMPESSSVSRYYSWLTYAWLICFNHLAVHAGL
jgi:hypothetical protein